MEALRERERDEANRTVEQQHPDRRSRLLGCGEPKTECRVGGRVELSARHSVHQSRERLVGLVNLFVRENFNRRAWSERRAEHDSVEPANDLSDYPEQSRPMLRRNVWPANKPC